MEKTTLEVITDKKRITEIVSFAISVLTKGEKSAYKTEEEYTEMQREMKSLDVFDPKFLYDGASRGEIAIVKVKKGNETVIVSAINRASSRILFFVSVDYEKYLNLAKKLLSQLTIFCDKVEPFIIVAFFNQAQYLEKLGFIRLRPRLTFNKILVVPMKQNVEQYDIQNY